MISDYVVGLREHVGHDLLLLPGVGAVVRDDDGRVLLIKAAHDGRWSLPAGMVEPGEQPADAVLREVAEETGIIAEVQSLAGVSKQPVKYPNGDRVEYLVVWFRCRALGGEPRPDGDESLEVAWFAPDALPPVGLSTKVRIEATANADAPPFFSQPKRRPDQG
jgi:8-oxo-dGTP diphosphatase